MMNEEEILKVEAEKKVEEAKQIEETPPSPRAEPELFQAHFTPDTPGETIRKSGLAYSAGLALVGSVVFMLMIGWLLDSFLGTSPWCLLGGIIIGSGIGFYQFFRLTSQILKKD